MSPTDALGAAGLAVRAAQTRGGGWEVGRGGELLKQEQLFGVKSPGQEAVCKSTPATQSRSLGALLGSNALSNSWL